MIKWYDYIFAVLTAQAILNAFFIPYVGILVSYFIADMWVLLYCQFRLNQQKNSK